jgi:hypothetical protein
MSSLTATVLQEVTELVERILSSIPDEIITSIHFLVVQYDALVSLTKSVLMHNTQSKVHSHVLMIKLSQQPVIAGSIVAVIGDAVIFEC